MTMSAIMTAKGPITHPGLTWQEQKERAWDTRLRSWEGVKVGPESGLSDAEIKSLRDHGFLG